jgi:succinate dehydrogenase / fumarate reductase membrane anchor subunit
MSVNYGSKRIVVGAHYGLRDWLSQRITAALMVIFTALVLGQVLLTSGPIGYEVWLRLSLQVFTIVWLVACAGWAIQVLWRL